MKRLIALALTICLTTALLVPSAAAKDYVDTRDHWAQDAVNEITNRGFFLGTSDTTFSPDATMTRAMFVTVLSRVAASMNLSVAHGADVKFADVDSGAYYADAVAWASENGIVQGVGNNTFRPGDVITRQQMCAILVRFLTKYAGFDLSSYTAELSVFRDAENISSYAAQAVETCYAMGLIAGVSVEDGVEFRPTATSNRATVAVVLWRLIQQVEAWDQVDTEKPCTAGGAGGAGGADSNKDKVDDEKKREEAQVAGYLETILQNCRSSKYLPATDQEVQDCMAILMDCVEDALRQRDDGAFLSKDFIRSEYASEISKLKAGYKELTENQMNQLNNVIVRLESAEHIFIVMDYFGVDI